MQQAVASVKEDRSLVRDLGSQAILSRDHDGFQQRLARKKEMSRILTNDQRINSLEEQVAKLTRQLEELLATK